MLIWMMLVVLMVLRAASARGGCPNLELVVLWGKSKVAQVDGSRGARRNPKSPQMAPPQHSQMPFCAPRAKNHAITLHRWDALQRNLQALVEPKQNRQTYTFGKNVWLIWLIWTVRPPTSPCKQSIWFVVHINLSYDSRHRPYQQQGLVITGHNFHTFCKMGQSASDHRVICYNVCDRTIVCICFVCLLCGKNSLFVFAPWISF